MKQKGFTELFVVLVIVFLGLGFLGLYIYQNSKKVVEPESSNQTETNEGQFQTISTTIIPNASLTSEPDIYGLATPPIMSFANWKKVSKDNWILNILTWENLTNSKRDELIIDGEEWIATKTLQNESELNNYFNSQQTISDKVNNELAKQNWTGSDFNYNNYRFIPYSYAGVWCSSEGYAKIIKNKTKVIYNYMCLDKKYYINNTTELNYPVKFEYRIFISKEIAIEDLIKQIESSN